MENTTETPPGESAFGSKLKMALDNLDSLPAMPDIAQKLLALPLDTEEGESRMLALIEQDPQLFARIIGLANSSAMGLGRKVSSIKDAAMLLGLKRLKAVAIGIATMSKLVNQPAAKNFDPHDLWSHSMTIAIVMNIVSREMPKRIRPDENQIFLAGLLHDIGLMALHFLDFDASDELHRQLRLQPRRSITDLELELLGMTHGQIGARLVKHWNLPREIVEVVGMHHSPDAGNVALVNPLVRLVNISEKLLPDFGFAEHTNESIDVSEWRELCIDPALADELAALVSELAMQVVQLPDTHNAAQSVMQTDKAPAPETTEAKQCATPPVPAPPATVAAAKPSLLSRLLAALFGWIGGLKR